MKKSGFGSGLKRGIASEYLPWILIAIAILVIILFATFIMKDKGILIIDKIKNLFRS
ncbi:MAG TPA: hypothetical protein VJH92_06590 [Candidatus Nanoarchaeia archaeon]|nr:hypothetical protein [Candidatus Nanoarchaeia archaeon]